MDSFRDLFKYLIQKTSIYFLYLFKQIFSHLCQNFLFTT